MSYPINQKIAPYQQPSMGIASSPLPNVDADRLKQNINDNPISKNASEQQQPLLLIGLMAPIWFGMVKFMDKFNKACATREDGKPNLLDRTRALGDNIQNKIIKPEQNMKLEGFFAKTKTGWEKFVNKFAITKAFFTTPSKPTNKMVLMMQGGTETELASSIPDLFKQYTEDGKNLEKIKNLGFVKNGAADVEKYNNAIEDTNKYLEDIKKACKNLANKGEVIHVERGGKLPLPKWISKGKDYYLSEKMPFTKGIFTKTVPFSEIDNKFEALQGLKNQSKNTTALGKILPKGLIRTIESLTNGTTGMGKIMMLMNAYIIADAIIKTKDAPKGEKTKTFAENMVYNLSMYLTIPLGIKLLHKFGGLQYIGMSKEQILAYRNKLKEYNKQIEDGLVTDKAKYKAMKQELKDMLKGDTKILKEEAGGTKTAKFFKNLIHKPLKFAGRVLTVGLENLKPFNPENIKAGSGFQKRFANFFKHEFGYRAKWAAGGPMRFIVYLMVIAPFLGKIAVKGSHLVFGKPTKSVLDNGDEPKKQEQKAPNIIVPQQEAQALAPTAIKTAATAREMAPTQTQGQGANLLNLYSQNNSNKDLIGNDTTTVKKPTKTYSYIPSSDGMIKENSGSSTRNSVGLEIPQVDVAMKKADGAEQEAHKFLKD